MSKEAMKLALEALELCNGAETAEGVVVYTDKEITALREALAEQPARPYRQLQDNGSKYFGDSWDKAEQPAQQEPVECANGCRGFVKHSPPAQRPWVGLTDEEISKMPAWIYSPDQDGMTAEEGLEVFARAIEAKLRSKNEDRN